MNYHDVIVMIYRPEWYFKFWSVKLFPEIGLSQNYADLQSLMRCIICENFDTIGLLDKKL